MPDPQIPANLLRYLVNRGEQRRESVEETLAAMTDRERALVREAAVMGYVRGLVRAGRLHHVDMPRDSVVLAEVVDACLALPDMYPVITSLTEATP